MADDPSATAAAPAAPPVAAPSGAIGKLRSMFGLGDKTPVAAPVAPPEPPATAPALQAPPPASP
ncbi:MAG: hypothetical protein KBE83_04235, partial [Comamonas sp.]|nr:hypothetical protein [Comamonas sp.]